MSSRATASWHKIGIKSAAVAVFEVISVKNIEIVDISKQIAHGGKGLRTSNWLAHHEAKPDHSSKNIRIVNAWPCT